MDTLPVPLFSKVEVLPLLYVVTVLPLLSRDTVTLPSLFLDSKMSRELVDDDVFPDDDEDTEDDEDEVEDLVTVGEF